jgi:succinate dehydrogenase/fumarate reductase flavoprotein subunit
VSTHDLVVVGYGAAGVAAAITAADAGTDVVVVERNPAHRHTPSTRMSGGMIMVGTDADALTDYLDTCADGMIPRECSARWATYATELAEWLRTRIGDLDLTPSGGAEHPGIPGAEAVVTLQPGGVAERLAVDSPAGPMLWSRLDAAVRRRGVQVLHNRRALRLTTDGSRVTGVVVDGPDGPERYEATGGVVLACGGFEFDEEMKRDHLRVHPAYFYGNPTSTGDGVRMAQAVGAGLWHMNQMIGRAIGHFTLEDGTELNLIIGIGPPGYVICDRDGSRFIDENAQALLRHDVYFDLLAYDPVRNRHPRVPCWWFFDERRRRAGPLTFANFGAVAVGLYDWSGDNSVEIERGWIARGSTIAEAAAAAGMDAPSQAAETVAEYNRLCETGDPDPLGRPPETMIALDEPPFYCVPLWPGGSNTTGGPRRDADGRILDAFGDPITGLYGAGELGQPTGMIYPADGCNLSEAFCSGQVAAEHALGLGP